MKQSHRENGLAYSHWRFLGHGGKCRGV